ncbi:MAG: RNA polymerase sigma factor [Nitrospirae bacterium]|nr:MAG: RNA polymerase sigma factor [Nitrospirota bacterium]
MDQFLAGVERRAFRIAHLAIGDHDDALDLVQDTMIKLVERYARREESEWAPLFYRILHNRIRDWHRRNWIRRRWRAWLSLNSSSDLGDSHDPLPEIPDPAVSDPGDKVDRTRAMAALETALHHLPFRQQQAFLLRAWEGFDVAQTAKIMECSEGSVKTHYSRAIHALRAQLKDYWP